MKYLSTRGIGVSRLPSEYVAAKAQIHQLLKAQVIRESSSSAFASLIMLVKKKDGSLCLWDLQGMHSPCLVLRNPLTRCLVLTGCQPWIWPQGTTKYQSLRKTNWRRCSAPPLGCSSGTGSHLDCAMPSILQRLMERIFVDQHCHSLLHYRDDVIVFLSAVRPL